MTIIDTIGEAPEGVPDRPNPTEVPSPEPVEVQRPGPDVIDPGIGIPTGPGPTPAGPGTPGAPLSPGAP